MRLSDLLRARVVAADGSPMGLVNDVRLVQAGPLQGTVAALVVEGLVVDHRHVGSMLGYDRRKERGPWLVRAAVRWLHRRACYVAWDDVADWDEGEGEVRLRETAQIEAVTPPD